MRHVQLPPIEAERLRWEDNSLYFYSIENQTKFMGSVKTVLFKNCSYIHDWKGGPYTFPSATKIRYDRSP
jgi:hypothetical protein